jgi:hypothetical protein
MKSEKFTFKRNVPEFTPPYERKFDDDDDDYDTDVS